FDGSGVANAAAELDGNGHRFANALDRGGIDRLARKGTVEIDHVKILEPLCLEGFGLRGRIEMKHCCARHVALLEPHAYAVLEVDGGKQDHVRAEFNRGVTRPRTITGSNSGNSQ